MLLALAACEGWLPRTALRWTAQFDRSPRGEMEASVARLLERGWIEQRHKHVLGSAGPGATLYRITASGLREVEG